MTLHLDPRFALARAVDVLGPARDIVCGRVEEPEPPAWCTARGWSDFVLSLSDEQVIRCEIEGAENALPTMVGTPTYLADFARAAARASSVPVVDSRAEPVVARAASPRKRAQLAAMLEAIAESASLAARVVDFGSGSGHLTRLSAAAFARPAVGLERDARRVARATDLAKGSAAFETFDALDAEFDLVRTDIAVGLHACGALGDRLVELASQAGAAVALVGCCPQKIRSATRRSLSHQAASLEFPREALGLANLSTGADGVERSTRDAMATRERRHALLFFLRARGHTVAMGDEMRGVNRRRAYGSFDDLVTRACKARSLVPPSRSELDAAQSEASRAYAAIRRLSLPRAALARLLEVFIALDRAAFLVERGQEARVVTLVPRHVTPRNVAVLAPARKTRTA